ncbi:hypothetical protein ABF226_002338 [Flavobacterium psychrophilum]|jgi:hypothetical protein
MKDNLTTKALKFISKRNGEYKPVDIKEFLLNNFPEKPEMAERLEMKRFIEFLTKSEYVEFITNHGIWFIVENGRKIPREEICVLLKITSKGFDLIRENDKYVKNSVSFYSSILFGVSALILGWRNYILQESREVLKIENVQLKENKKSLQIENAQIKANLNRLINNKKL